MTRRHPRTTREAFRDADYANAIERHTRTGYPALWWVLVCAIGLAALFLVGVTA